MNMSRVVLGGVVGGVVYNIVSIIVNVVALADRYTLLQSNHILRTDPRIPFLPIWIVLLFLVSIGLVWLYAAARPRLGPGPKTAFCVGITAGLIAGLPGNLAQFSWSQVGGFVSACWAVETIAGCTLATITGAWVYKE